VIFPRKVDFSCFGYHPDLESRLTIQEKWVLGSPGEARLCARSTAMEEAPVAPSATSNRRAVLSVRFGAGSISPAAEMSGRMVPAN
jgi:hypothetical protein